MSSSRGRTAHSFPPIGSKRGESSLVSRSKKKQKRLEDICDSPVSLAVRGSADEAGDDCALRRSTRARKVTVFPDFSPEPFYPKIGKSVTRGGNVNGGGKLRGGTKNAVAVDIEIARTPETDKVGAADGSSDGEEASDYRSIRSSRLAEGRSGASAAFKFSFTNFNEQNEEEDRSLRPGECLEENLDASTLELNRKMKRRRKIKRINPGKRNQIQRLPTDYEENKLHDCPLREQEISASPSDDNDENRKNTTLKEDNREEEDQSQDRSKVAECGTSTHEKSFAEDDDGLASEVPSSTAECKFYSRRTTSTRTRVTSEEAPLESENQATLREDLLKFGRNAPTSSSDEDFAEEKDETSTEKASPKEEDRIIKEIVSPAGDTPLEDGSEKFNPLNGEATERTPCQLENGFIENHAGIQMGRSETNLPESHNSRAREGRRCGLCGGGTDGKPAKKLILASAESDNEQYNGTSSSEEPTYDVWDGFGEESDWLGKLLGPIRDRLGIARVWVHQQCAVWSPEVYFAGLGRLKSVRAALCRGRALKCSRCGRPGATIGCRVDRCPKTYHLPCARAENSIFDHRKFLIGCSDHRHLFQPQGIRYLQRIKKIKTRKMKLDLKKLSNEASRKDLEAEEKWLENCGEDEEFLKREGKRLHRDMQRIAPVFIGGDSSGSDTSAFKGWESVAGLNDVIRCLKEVVILPLLYPEVFTSLALSPPRGVLLHGYPGTGKTHVVRALIGECARGDKRIAYFARKGADCLGKYVGDAERQLRLLFQVAEKSQPSIIFFDEIDGLAPCRSKRQDQTHNSVVATLLSLLDGLKSRGSVVVIGATNRPDSVDPALRRPGRFDREIYFPLPSVNDRSMILSLLTKNWPKPLSRSLLSWVSKQTAGFAGADLQALCTQAAMIALKRNFPLHEILLNAEKVSGNGKKPPLPSFSVLERDWHSALASAPPPCSRREAGMAANEVIAAPLPSHLVPCLLLPLCYLLLSFYFEERMWVPPPLLEAAKFVKDVIFAALRQMRKPVTSWKYHLPCLFQKENIVQEIERHLSYVGLLGSTSTPIPLKDDSDDFERSKLHGHQFSKPNISFGLQKPSGFRVLITGNRRSGQRHLAACLLDQFLGHIDIQKVTLSTLSQEGRGNIILGITQILSRCMNGGWCVVYMPRLDLWAMDEVEIEDQNSRESSGRDDLGKTAIRSSSAWDSFVEHMNSMCGSSSLIVLATCEMACDDIPARVSGFFTTGDMNNRNAATSEHTIPRFFVQVDGIVDRSVAITSSVSRIACDVIKEYIQFLHRRSHASNIHHDMKVLQETKFPKVCDGQGKVSEASPKVDQSQHIEQNAIISRSPLSRNMKGSSTVMISALGYQILQYPQFAELCWSTSKVKGGPCADVSGPWKIWPFNSCIIRPHESADKSMLPSISRNSKNKEISGLVRGLVAVGLLAYRGSYSSVREVSSQVRIVLELLVELIYEKIQRGKNSYRYSRILSQVAYMEDLVNSWAYAFMRSSVKIDEDSYAPTSCGPRGNEVAEETQGKNGELVKNADSDTPKVDHVVDPNVNHGVDQGISTSALIKPVDSEQSDGNLKELTSFESLCVYACCSDCFQSVNASVQEIVTRCWEAGRYPPTVDRFHDIVTLCSLNLVSAVRKHFLSLDDGEFFPAECNRHSSDDSGLTSGLKFLFRDGILLTSDPPEGAQVHCSLGRLCLRSVCELVVKSPRVKEAGSW